MRGLGAASVQALKAALARDWSLGRPSGRDEVEEDADLEAEDLS